MADAELAIGCLGEIIGVERADACHGASGHGEYVPTGYLVLRVDGARAAARGRAAASAGRIVLTSRRWGAIACAR